MSKTFELLSGALDEAIQDTKQNHLPRHTRTLQVEPLAMYTSNEIKEIRHQIGLTQLLFAQYFGVSLKTVEAWESGRNMPSGPSRRLLGLLAKKKISL